MRLLEQLRFGKFAPDQPTLGNPGMELVRNVLPRLNGYDSLPQLNPYLTDLLPERATGALGAKGLTGETYLYVGTVEKLYSLSGTQWNDVSKLAGSYTDPAQWQFAQFGDVVIAGHIGDRLQAITLGAANFDNLTSSLIQASTIAAVRRFLVAGDVLDDDGYTPERVRWSPIDNPAGDWTPSPTTQAGFNDLKPAGGRVVRMVGGEFGLVFRERATWRMTYTGISPLFWQFDEVDPGIGALSAGSVVRHGGRTFFFSEDGIRATIGEASQPIGEERIDISLLSDLDTAHLERISGAVYTDEQIIVWAYPGPGNVGGQPNRLALYNYASDNFSFGDEAIEILFQAAVPSRSVDGFDNDPTYGGTQDPPLYATLEDVPGSFDDAVWGGGPFQLGAIGGDGDLNFYTGPPRPAEFVTGERQHTPGRRTFIREVRPLLNDETATGTTTLEIGYRNKQSDLVTWTPPVSAVYGDIISARTEARYHRYRILADAGFEDAVGIDIYGTPAGGR